MAIKLSWEEYEQYFQPSHRPITTDSQSGYSEAIYERQGALHEGYAVYCELAGAFRLDIESYQLHEPISLEVSAHPHPLEISFQLSGGWQNQCDQIPAGHHNFVGCGTHPECIWQPNPHRQIRAIQFHVDPEWFKTVVGIKDDAIPPELMHLFRPFSQECYNQVGVTTPQMQIVLQQIWQCSFQGWRKPMFLSSKIIELMTLRLQQGIEAEAIPRPEGNLTRDRVDHLHQVKELLERRMENPPSIQEMSQQAGLSYYQLKQGFRKLFGKTPSQYLQQYRMEQARLLLHERNVDSVAEVANTVGYSHLGQFAAAFERQFGILPSDCLQGKRPRL